MTNLVARLLHVLASLFARLPWSLLYRIGDAIAWLWQRTGARESRVAERNLELALPALPDPERRDLQRAVLRTTARQVLETLRFWTRSHDGNLALIDEQAGVELFDAALARGRGVIIAAPHYGNWELLNQWLASRTPLAILYRAPESAIGEAFLQRVRGDDRRRVVQVRADGTAVRQLLRTLHGGGVVGILPDQQPKVGEGAFAPFFGRDALTMTLLTRLAARSGATVLFAWCERIDWSPRFRLCIEAATEAVSATDPVHGVRALNAAIERIARRDLSQYQWTYKRYTLRPPESGERNPYRDFETHR